MYPIDTSVLYSCVFFFFNSPPYKVYRVRRQRGINTFTRVYVNPLKERKLIFLDNKGSSGIYCWYNKINSQKYVGSAIKLTDRINDYFQFAYQKDKANLPIVRALKKYGMDSFILFIIEYVEPSNLILREQYWINTLQPKYNILSEAGNSSGFKHSEETKNLISFLKKGSTHSLEIKKQMSISRMGINNSFFGQTHSEDVRKRMSEYAKNRVKDPKPGLSLVVYSLEGVPLFNFKSVREASRELNADPRTMTRSAGSDKAFRGKYFIKTSPK